VDRRFLGLVSVTPEFHVYAYGSPSSLPDFVDIVLVVGGTLSTVSDHASMFSREISLPNVEQGRGERTWYRKLDYCDVDWS
jgi:hypothetical protein